MLFPTGWRNLLAGVAAALRRGLSCRQKRDAGGDHEYPRRFRRRVSFYLRSCLCGAELRDRERYSGQQFVLRPGHRFDGMLAHFRSWLDFWRSVQSGGRDRCGGDENLIKISDMWIHIVADLAGGLLAALTFKFLNPTDK